MYIGEHARTMPDKAALIDVATGTVQTFRSVNDRSNQFAQFLWSQGLRRGDHVAFMLENRPELLEVAWACMRSGLYFTSVNRYLTAEEAGYIVDDCDADVLVASAELAAVAERLPALARRCRLLIMLDAPVPGWLDYETVLAGAPASALAEEWIGDSMLYSSGTTGRPKGILRDLPDAKLHETFRTAETLDAYCFDNETIYLSPAPLYHAAPLSWALGTQHRGGTVVMMRKFDPVAALALIEAYRVTHSQWVPTMFVRMLKLPEHERQRFDLSSMRYAVHAAAPCPVEIKREMLAWWGPIIHEYYAGTESNGTTRIGPLEWLDHPGSVGRATIGTIHICADDGHELPTGEPGLIYFERDTMPFAYHKDPKKTEQARHPQHRSWSTLGDVGYLDAEGFLYLTDRKAFMIISGGVNIYPQGIEDALIGHPKVRDAAVFGVPNPEMGEDVKAVVELVDDVEPSDAVSRELIEYLTGRVARFMVPRSLDFIEEMPRLPTGKLYKQKLRARYLEAPA